MKRVFKNHAEVCHVWASQSQDSGRAGNITFSGGTIFSYGWWPMAQFVDTKEGKMVLVRDWPYSSSTAKHLHYVHSALSSDFTIFWVNDPGKYGSIPHVDNLTKYLRQIKEAYEKFPRAIRNKEYILNGQKDTITTMHRYIALFDLTVPDYSQWVLDTEKNRGIVKLQEARNAELERLREEKRKHMIDNAAEELAKLEREWIAGRTNKTGLNLDPTRRRWDVIPFSQIRLRVKPEVDSETVQTSMGAYVSLREAKILYDRIQAGKDIKGFKIGHYTVIGINGALKIGCHEITREEIDRFAQSQGW
jgi:hypothetical protein